MFKVGQTVKTRLGFPVQIIAVLDTPATDGHAIVGVRTIDPSDRDITTYWPDGRFMSSRTLSCNDILPLPEIITEFVHPPIPMRNCDWAAKWSDADDELNQRGWGATEAEAIADLKDNYPRDEDQAEAA